MALKGVPLYIYRFKRYMRKYFRKGRVGSMSGYIGKYPLYSPEKERIRQARQQFRERQKRMEAEWQRLDPKGYEKARRLREEAELEEQ